MRILRNILRTRHQVESDAVKGKTKPNPLEVVVHVSPDAQPETVAALAEVTRLAAKSVRLWAKRHLNNATPEQYRKSDLEKFFGCCPEMQTEDEAALRRGDGQIVDEQSIEAKVAHFIKVAGPAFEGVDLKTYMDEVRER